MKKARKRKYKQKPFIILFLILVVIGISVWYFFFQEKPITVTVISEIDGYSYHLNSNETRLYKKYYKELEKELKDSKVDEENYAKLISKLFIIDFYTLSNKTSINDVGSVQFVYSSYKSDFIDYAREGIYKQVKSNLDNDRSQDLPEVKSVTIDSIEEIVPSTELKSDDFKNVTDPEAYKVKINWDYTKSNDFQTSATMVIVKDGEKLSVAKLEDE